MDKPTFDRWTTSIGRLPNRRAVLWALIAAPIAAIVGRRAATGDDSPTSTPPATAIQTPTPSALTSTTPTQPPGPAIAAGTPGAGRAAPAICGGPGQVCEPVTAPCCTNSGLRCREGRCRCRVNFGRCDNGPACLDLRRNAAHCGQCNRRCRGSTPCCIDGQCRPRCGGRCCSNCFVVLKQNGTPKPGSELCCGRDGGKRCGSPRADEQCCYPDEVCLNGACCGVTNRGLTNCRGECCATDACCDGVCCATGRGKVCTPASQPNRRCVSGTRSCRNASNCLAGEACDGGTCCSGLRRCYANGGSSRICCPPGEWCAVQNNPALANCIPVGEAPDRTYRGHRVRP